MAVEAGVVEAGVAVAEVAVEAAAAVAAEWAPGQLLDQVQVHSERSWRSAP